MSQSVPHGRASRRSAAHVMTRAFTARVLAVVRRIPPGRVASYGQVAELAGYPRAARAVGNVMRECHSPDVPCHRVIAAGGRLGGYGGSESLKRALLIAEGIVVRGSRVRHVASVTVPLDTGAAPPSSRRLSERKGLIKRRAATKRNRALTRSRR
jgi:O-6-methylguanine DNA methyltransferase